MEDMPGSTHYRSVFISDIHLGTRGCQAEFLLDFMRHKTCERFYLVGDIVDVRRFLVVHGDEFGAVVRRAAWLGLAGALYINDGDWVESCTALVEHGDGRLEILHWAELRSWSMIDRSRRVDETRRPTTEPSIA